MFAWNRKYNVPQKIYLLGKFWEIARMMANNHFFRVILLFLLLPTSIIFMCRVLFWRWRHPTFCSLFLVSACLSSTRKLKSSFRTILWGQQAFRSMSGNIWWHHQVVPVENDHGAVIRWWWSHHSLISGRDDFRIYEHDCSGAWVMKVNPVVRLLCANLPLIFWIEMSKLSRRSEARIIFWRYERPLWNKVVPM